MAGPDLQSASGSSSEKREKKEPGAVVLPGWGDWMVHSVRGTYGFNRFRPSDVLWWRTRAFDVVTGKSKAPFGA